MPNIPNPAGNDFFEAIKVESIWHIGIGEKLPFIGTFNGSAVRTNRIDGGSFGVAYEVSGWLGEGIPSFPTNHTENSDPSSVKQCCAKVISQIEYDDGTTEAEEDCRERVYEEYKILLQASGANGRVARPLGLGRASISGVNYWCIVMEYLTVGDGSTFMLKDRRNRLLRDLRCIPGGANPKQAATFAYSMALSLRDLHNCRDGLGITHRDLHPNNVAVHLSENNGRMEALSRWTWIVDRVFFLDLGQSTLPELDTTPIFGGRGVRLASYPYGAPEMFDLDAWRHPGSLWKWRNRPTVDIWSMGALIFFFATGQTPAFDDHVAGNAQTDAGRMVDLQKIGTLPKKNGLRIDESDILGSSDPETMKLLDQIIRLCTVYNPEERACIVRLDDIIGSLSEALGVVGGATPKSEAPAATRRASLGPIEFKIREDYQVDSQQEEFCAYHRTNCDDETFKLIMRLERYGFKEEEKEEYTNAVISRVGALFMNSGGDESFLNLETLAHHGAFVRPGRGEDHAYRVISFTTMRESSDSFVANVRIYFFEGIAFIVGLGCLCSEDRDYQVKLEIEREMELLGSSVRSSSQEEANEPEPTIPKP